MNKKRFEHFYESSEDIPLILDSYEDLFSDFDPRDFSERAVSDDFLFECRRAAADKKGKIKLRLFVPKNKRNSMNETKIKKRLKGHFSKHLQKKKKEVSKIRAIGFNWLVSGMAIIILTALFLEETGPLWLNILIALAHPAGWFFTWEGLAKILISSKEKMPDYNFYEKMTNAEISFVSY